MHSEFNTTARPPSRFEQAVRHLAGCFGTASSRRQEEGEAGPAPFVAPHREPAGARAAAKASPVEAAAASTVSPNVQAFRAIASNHCNALEVALSRGVHRNVVAADTGESLLLAAVRRAPREGLHTFDCIHALLNGTGAADYHPPDLLLTDSKGQNVFHAAAERGTDFCVRFLRMVSALPGSNSSVIALGLAHADKQGRRPKDLVPVIDGDLVPRYFALFDRYLPVESSAGSVSGSPT